MTPGQAPGGNAAASRPKQKEGSDGKEGGDGNGSGDGDATAQAAAGEAWAWELQETPGMGMSIGTTTLRCMRRVTEEGAAFAREFGEVAYENRLGGVGAWRRESSMRRYTPYHDRPGAGARPPPLLVQRQMRAEAALTDAGHIVEVGIRRGGMGGCGCGSM